MNKYYTFALMVALTFLLLSNSSNPPIAHTGAPGESFCSNCHSLNNSTNQGTISVLGFPDAITPGQKYLLTVVNRNTNDGAIRAGFQLTILGPTNKRAGDMDSISSSSVLVVSGGRQYFEHHPSVIYPDSNVVKWTFHWKAPMMASGSKITYYADGIVANGNNNTSGDRTVTAKGSGTIIVSAATDLAEEHPTIYPNPGSDVINVQLMDHPQPDGEVIFYNMTGQKEGESEMKGGHASVPVLTPGLYCLIITNNNKSYSTRWIKI